MKRFEYQVKRFYTYQGEDWETRLNKLGVEGWELVSVVNVKAEARIDGGIWVFLKRKLEDA